VSEAAQLDDLDPNVLAEEFEAADRRRAQLVASNRVEDG
jgi:hypothetical protein